MKCEICGFHVCRCDIIEEQKEKPEIKTIEQMEFGIDSGSFWIGDLGYIVGHPEKYGKENSWREVCEQMRQPLPANICEGIMFSPGCDGGYKVNVHKTNDRVTKVEIFMGDRE